MRVWCPHGVLDVYSGGVGPVITHRGALAANHQQAHSLKVRMSATTRERRQEWVTIQLPRQFL